MIHRRLDVTWRWWVKLAQFSRAFLCLYVGAYYATVCPVPRFVDSWGQPKTFVFSGQPPWHSYQIGGYRLPLVTHLMFRPIHVIDRKLRPETWWMPDDDFRPW